MDKLNTLQDIKKFSQELVDNYNKSVDKSKQPMKDLIEVAEGLNNADDEIFNTLASLLSLPDEQFMLIAPVMLETMSAQYNDPNERLLMVQAMNLSGVSVEDAEREYAKICDVIDESTGEVLSTIKRNFLKELLGIAYNCVSEANTVASRIITIPIELSDPNAKAPAYAHATDAGMDIYALEDITIAPGETKLIPTGIKVAIPEGYELQVRPKSGRCLKTKLRVANAPGTIDAGYRDEIGVIIDNIDPYIKKAEIGADGKLYNVEFGSSYTIGKGEKFAQLVLATVPKVSWLNIESISQVEGDRNGGFGSTGLK